MRFRNARSDPDLAVLEGFHALRHAARFGAAIETILTRDRQELISFSTVHGPAIENIVRHSAEEVSAETFSRLAPAPPATGVIAIARRRSASVDEILGNELRAGPAVLLEHPAHRGNIGAVIRVAASAGAAAVVTTGRRDPWDPSVIRGAAGLHYAVDVVRSDTLGAFRGPLIAIHAEGEALSSGAIPRNALLAFGSERRGLSEELLSRADGLIGIPMRSGVSSLNLATAVAVVLYTWRLAQPAESS